MKELTIREKAAKSLYEADLNISEDISVRQIVDLLESFGNQIGTEYYHKGVSDAILGRVSRVCGNLPGEKSV